MLNEASCTWLSLSPDRQIELIEQFAAMKRCSGVELLDFARELAAGRPAIVSGSVVEGYATCSSDLDVFVFDDSSEEEVRSEHVKDVRIDFEVRHASRIERLGEALARPYACTYPLVGFGSANLAVGHALLIGVPIAEEGDVRRLAGLLDTRRLRFHRLRRHIDEADAFVQDAVGSWLDRNGADSVSRARLALNSIVDGYLVYIGDTSHNSKHRVRRLQCRVQDSAPLLSRYIDLVGNWPSTQRDALTTAAEMVRTARDGLSFLRRELDASRLRVPSSPLPALGADGSEGPAHGHDPQPAEEETDGLLNLTTRAVASRTKGDRVFPTAVPDDLVRLSIVVRVLYRENKMWLASYERAYDGECGARLDLVATRICELCDGKRSIATVARLVAQEFRAPPDRVLDDTLEFAQALIERGLLERVDRPQVVSFP